MLWCTYISCMAVQMEMVGGLRASTRKHPHTDAIQTVKHFQLFIIDLDRTEHSSFVLSVGGERNLPSHVIPRSVLKRNRVSARSE
jgi:hypothetical protein